MVKLLERRLVAIYSQSIKGKGDDVKEDDTVIVLEAMKMETTIKTPHAGSIINVFVSNGDKVNVGDPLFEVI